MSYFGPKNNGFPGWCAGKFWPLPYISIWYDFVKKKSVVRITVPKSVGSVSRTYFCRNHGQKYNPEYGSIAHFHHWLTVKLLSEHFRTLFIQLILPYADNLLDSWKGARNVKRIYINTLGKEREWYTNDHDLFNVNTKKLLGRQFRWNTVGR